MIKVEDLRFGSILQIEDQIITVGIIDEDFISWKYNIKDRSFWNPYISLKDERLKPIELTEEILLKCGFLNWNGYYSKGDIKYEEENIILNFWSDDSYVIKGIKHLHQLQNLFWCLCGEELKINL